MGTTPATGTYQQPYPPQTATINPIHLTLPFDASVASTYATEWHTELQHSNGSVSHVVLPGRAARRNTAPTPLGAEPAPQVYVTPAQHLRMGGMYLSPPPRYEGSSPPPRPPQAPGGNPDNQQCLEALRRPKYPQPTWSGDSGVGFGDTRFSTIELFAAASAPTVNSSVPGLDGSGGMSLQYAELEELPQEPYKDGNKMSDFGVFANYVPYGSNCRVDMLLRKDVSGVPNPNDVPLPLAPNGPLSSKPSFRMQFPYCSKHYRQVNVARCTSSQIIPPTRGWLAILAAREMNRFLERCEREGKPFKYRLEQLYLLRIDCVSSGSLQPRFGVRKSSGCASVSQMGAFA